MQNLRRIKEYVQSLTLTLHEDEIKTAKYGFYAVERCSVSSDRQGGYRICQNGKYLCRRLVREFILKRLHRPLRLDVNGTGGVILGG